MPAAQILRPPWRLWALAARCLKVDPSEKLPDLAFAYGSLINAQLRVKDEPAALATSKTMHNRPVTRPGRVRNS